MAEKTFQLELITPSEQAYNKDVVSINVPGSEGYFGVLAGHAPLIASLKEGLLKIQEPNNSELFMNIKEGFLEVLNNRVVILVDKAEIESSE